MDCWIRPKNARRKLKSTIKRMMEKFDEKNGDQHCLPMLVAFYTKKSCLMPNEITWYPCSDKQSICICSINDALEYP